MASSAPCLLTASSVRTVPRTTPQISSRCPQIITSQRYPSCEQLTNFIMRASYKQKTAVVKANLMPVEKTDEGDRFQGTMLNGGVTFQQSFEVKSYETGADKKITVPALVNYVQEIGINHFQSLGVGVGGHGCTREMHRMNLIWVIRTTDISVQSYPSRRDVIDITSWARGTPRGMYRESILRNMKTGETIANVLMSFLLMNKNTRKLTLLPEEIYHELNHLRVSSTLPKRDLKRLRGLDIETADQVRKGLMPLWNDLDLNGHVNNVKYINWILEGVPDSIQKDYVLDKMWLEYRRECSRDCILQSLSARVGDGDIVGDSRDGEVIGFDHSLLLQDGVDITRARTQWRPKSSHLGKTQRGTITSPL